MAELTKEERLARALSSSQAEENVQEEPSKPLTKEERLARALELSQAEDKKKSQSQSVSSTEESSSGTSATKKEQSSGTTKPLSLEEKKELARKQKLGQLDEKKQESKLALERKQKSTNINWDVDKETEQAFKGVATKEEKMEQAKQEAMSVGETYVPNIEEKARAKEIQEAKPEQDLQRRLNLIPKEDLKSIFEGDNELTMFDGGQRLAEKYKLTEEEVDKAKAKYLEETVKEFKRKDLESSLDLIGKYAPAPKDFKDITAYTQNIELLNKAKEMNFEKNKNLSFSLMGLEDNDRKVVDEYSSVMDRLNAYKEKSFMQQQQGADETGKGSMVINPKEIAQFEKDLKESQRLSKEIDKIRGNNNKLFDQYANIINKETGKEVTQESFTSKYENDYMKLKGALTDATYKLNYVEKEARRIRDTAQKAARGQTPKENEALSNLDRERNLAKAEVLALSNALFLNEDITRKVARYEKADSYYQMPGKKAERLFEVLSDLKQGFSETVLGEFNMTSTSEKNQARILNEKLKEVGINLKDIDKQLAPTFPEKTGNVLGTSAVLGANIAVTSFLTGGAGTLARGAGLLPKVFAMYDKGGKFSKIANMVISGVNFELASDDTSFAMGAAEEGAQIVFEKVFSKLKPLSPLVNFLTKSLTGAIGVTGEEYFGDLAEQFTKTGISQETLDATFGKTKEEGLEKFALTFTMGMMSIGKHAKILMVGSYEAAKAKNPNSTTVKQMEEVMSEMGVDPDDVIKQLKAEAQTKSDRLYPDGKGGQLSASNMTVEQEIVLREKLKYKPLTEEELDIKRTVQEQEELAPADSPYVTKKEMDDDLKVLKGEDEGTLPETYVGESVRTEEGIVTTVTEKVEEGTQLRVPTEQLVVDEAKPVAETFDRKKAGVIDVWQDTETNELFVINGTKRVATAMEDGVASVDVNFVKANDLQEAYKIGDLKNKLEDTDKTIDAVELVKANPTLKENLDLSKPKEAELYGLASLNESLTEELKSNPNQAGVLSIIGNNVSTEKQSEVYQFAKDNNLGKDEVAQLVKEPNLLEKIKTKGVTEEKVSVQPKNIKDLYNVNRKLFGLDKLKSLSSAVVMDRMIGVMAKRAKITKEQMYGRLKFEKASEEFVKNLSSKSKLLYQIVGENAQLGQNVRDNLQVARDMEASGNDAKTIRIATGWEKGKDGKWRYEIEDPLINLKEFSFNKKTLEDFSFNGVYPKNRIIQNILTDYDRRLNKKFDDRDYWLRFINSSTKFSEKEIEGALIFVNNLVDNQEIKPIRNTVEIKNKKSLNVKLSDIISFDLIKLYPNLADIDVVINLRKEGEPSLGVKGSFSDSKIEINTAVYFNEVSYEEILSNNQKEINSILLHEIQHAIQHIEGFAKGGSPENVSGNLSIDDKLMDIYRNLPKLSREDRTIARDKLRENGLNTSVNFYFDINKNDVDTLENAIERIEILNKLFPSKVYVDLMNAISDKIDNLKGVESKTSYEKYLALAGEVEARNVQTRMGMTSAQRRETTLEETEDVARDEQTVLFQKTQNKAQGAAMVANDGKAIIYALTDPNVSTPLHELAHVYEHYLTDAERKTIQEFAGTTEWTTETSEVFARGFEKYLAEGVAPNSILQKVFEKFKEWLIDIYNGIKGSDIDIELNKPMRDIYAQMVGADNSLIKAEVEIKTELSKTGQSNIDALSKDATQLGMEPETLYDRVLSNSTTVKALTEKYAKGVADGLYSTTEATNRLNAEIKENLDAIKKEAGLDEAKKEVAQLESALTSDKKTSSDVLRDIASKIDKMADKMSNNTYSTIFGVEPLIAKAFLKTLSATLKTSANFIDGFNKAIAKFKNSDILKGKTAQEINDIVAQLTKATTDIKQIADLKNPITKLQQSKVKQNVRDRVKHLYKTQMTSLPTLKSIEKIATNYGIIDTKTFAEKLYKDLDGLEKTRAKRMETFEGAISDFIAKGGGNIKSLFNQLSTLILKDKEQAVILKNTILKALTDANTKGLKFSQQQLNQITSAFEKANLTNLSGIYDLTSKIDQIVNKAVFTALNNNINDLQGKIKRYAKSLKNVKQKEYIKALTDLNGSQILDEQLKKDLIETLENVKEYLSNKDELNYDKVNSEEKLQKWQDKISEYKKDKEDALNRKSHENYLDNNPGVSISFDDYKELVLPLENELKEEERLQKLEDNKEKRRGALETVTANNIKSIIKSIIPSNSSALKIQTIKKLKDTLQFYLDNNLLSSLTIKELVEINRVSTEIEQFNSYSKAGTLNSQLSGVKHAIENQANMIGKLRDFTNKVKRILFSPTRNLWISKDMSLKGLHRLMERMFVGEEAGSIGAIIFGSLDNGKNIAIEKSNIFAQKLKKLSDFELNRKENFDLGLKTFLLSSPETASEIDAQLLFERKKEKVAMDIEKLNEVANDNNQNESTRKQARIRAELYQNSLDNINKYDDYLDFVDAYENGDLLTKSQKLVDDFIKSEYSVQQDQLEDSNELYGDKEFERLKYYSAISYLNSPDVEVKTTEELENKNNKRSIDDATSGTTFKRVEDPRTVRDILDFDYYNVSKRRVKENYLDIHTRGSRIQINAFLNSKQFEEVFKGNKLLLNEFKRRVVEYLNSNLERQRSNLKQDTGLYKYIRKKLTAFRLSVLARPGQIVKQLTIIAHAISRLDVDFLRASGIYLANRFTASGNEKLTELIRGADSSNRKPIGDEQFSQEVAKLSERNLTVTEVYKFLDKHISKMFGGDVGKLASDIAVKYPTKIARGGKAATIDSGIYAMTYPDLLLNKLTFIGAMIKEQRKQIKQGVGGKEKLGMFPSLKTLSENKDIENTFKADRVAGFINNESDPTKQGGMFTKPSLVNALFYQFKSMAVNASIGAQNAMLDLFDKNATKLDKEIALRNLIGWSSSIVLFHATSLALYQATKKLTEDPLREALGAKEDKEKAKKSLNFIDNWDTTEFWEAFSFKVVLKAGIDAISGGVLPSTATDILGWFLEPKAKRYMEEATGLELEVDETFIGGWNKYSGAIANANNIVESFTDIYSPYVKNAEKLREKDVLDIVESQFEALNERPQETLIDIVYQLSMMQGKGSPAQAASILKKVLRENYKVKSGNYERLNTYQNPKEDK